MTTPRRFRTYATAVALTLAMALAATAKYSGGSGTADDPYQIATAADLIALGETPEDYDKHFTLTADIDLDPGLPGGRVFTKAVIAPHAGTFGWPYSGPPFAGVLDGGGHTIGNLTVDGGRCAGLIGQLASGAEVKNLRLVGVDIVGSDGYSGGLVGLGDGAVTDCSSVGAVRGHSYIGGLVGYGAARLTRCFSSGVVYGSKWSIGGLVGYSCGHTRQCYSTASVSGATWVGGLVGENANTVTECYSTGAVSGGSPAGGLVGKDYPYSAATRCFWDLQTSGRTGSAGGTGKTTTEMQTVNTFLEAGWDFMGETANGTEDVWMMPTRRGYPLLSWQEAGATAAPGEDFEMGDFRRFPWQHAGDEFWSITSTKSCGGSYSARAGAIGDNETSTLRLTLACGAGEIRFYVSVSSEPVWDKLVFRIDGLYLGEWSGEQDWTEVAFPVGAGTRTFEWQYVKDGGSSQGEDTAWLDDIVFCTGEASVSPPPDGKVVEVSAADFDTAVLGSSVPVLVNFYATWCPYCMMMLPIVEDVAHDYAGKALVAKIDVDNAAGICARYAVTAIPTFITFRNGQMHTKMVGTRSKQDLTAAIDTLLAPGLVPDPAHPATNHLIAHWALDETSGTIARDSAGAHDGWVYGNPIWLPSGGRIGGALRFDGVDDYVDTHYAQNLTTWTVSAWVKSPAAPSARTTTGPVHRERNYQINWDHDNPQFRGAAALAVGGTWYSASLGPLAANTWYHLAATYDGNALRAYRNGYLATANTAPSGVPDTEPASLKLGCHAVWQGQCFAGTVDEVRLYDRALSVEEVMSLLDASP